MDKRLLGQNIKFLRKKRGWSQDQLAEMLDVRKSMISRYEVGSNLPRADALVKISELFQVSLDDLVKKDLRGYDIPYDSIEAAVSQLSDRLDNIEYQIQNKNSPEEQKDLLRRLVKEFPEVAKEINEKLNNT